MRSMDKAEDDRQTVMEDWRAKAQKIPLIGRFFDKRPKVAVLRLSGVIRDGGRKPSISHTRYAEVIDKAFDKADKAVALVINCPGGTPAQTSLIASHIRRKAEEKEIPVLAFVEDVAASGGYWLACAADEIYAQPTSIIGSVGVVTASFGFDELIKNYGVERRVYTAGDEKAFLDPFLPEDEKDVKRLKTLQKDMHEEFKSWVKQRRGERLNGTDKTLFEGQFWTAGTAIEKGFADETGDVYTTCYEKFGKDIKFADFSPDKKLLPSLLPFTGQINLADDLAGTIADRTFWSRFGL